jgi:hypothetical protein
MSKQPKPLSTNKDLRKFLQNLEDQQRLEAFLNPEDMAEILTQEFLERFDLQ